MWRFAAFFKPNNTPHRQSPRARRSRKTALRAHRRRGRLECLEQRSLLAVGVLDTTFGNGGVAATTIGTGNADLFDMAIAPGGKLVAVGLAQGQGYAVARYNADGSLDTTFGTLGIEIIPSTGGAHHVAIQSDGKIVLAGDTNGAPDQTVVIRLNDSGALDPTFGTGGKVTFDNGGGTSLAIDSAGRILVAASGKDIERLNTDGTLDTTFGANGIAAAGVSTGNSSGFEITRADIQPDGKIVLSGYGLSMVSNTLTYEITVARLNADGTPDTSFGSVGAVSTSLRGMDDGFAEVIQPDGKIVIGGASFRPPNASGYDLALLRFDADGALDNSFGTGGTVVDTFGTDNSEIDDLLVQPNGEIVAAGQAQGLAALFRFNADGSLDSGFGNGGVALGSDQGIPSGRNFGEGQAVVQQASGNYVLGGIAGSPDDFALERFTGEAATITPVVLTAVPASLTEGATVSNQTLATFTDPNGDLALSNYQATIDWGDSTSSSTATVSGPDANGVFTVLGSHTYAEESANMPLTVTVLRNGADAASLRAPVQIADAPLTGVPLTLSATAGTALSGPLASFSDGNAAATASDFTATVEWGDGVTTSGTVSADSGAFIVLGSHVYSDAAPLTAPIRIIVNDDGGSSTTIDSQAIVAQPNIAGNGATLSGTQGATLSAVSVAAFTRGDGSEPASDFSASIDWGDGQSSTGTVTESAGAYRVVGTHAYASSGNFTIDTTVSAHGSSASIEASAAIAPAATPHQLYVESVYHDVLGRSPDPSGLIHWSLQLDGGAPPSSVAESIAHSDEYYANFVIKPDYLKFLGRTADDNGVSYWTTKMQAGMTDGQLAAQLVGSDEFFKQAGGTNSAWIDAAYQALLGRAADAGGQAYWAGRLSAGESRPQVAQGFTASVESEKIQINDDYLHYLGRSADPTGLDHWLAQFAAGGTNEDLIAAFTGSDEYYKAHSG